MRVSNPDWQRNRVPLFLSASVLGPQRDFGCSVRLWITSYHLYRAMLGHFITPSDDLHFWLFIDSILDSISRIRLCKIPNSPCDQVFEFLLARVLLAEDVEEFLWCWSLCFHYLQIAQIIFWIVSLHPNRGYIFPVSNLPAFGMDTSLNTSIDNQSEWPDISSFVVWKTNKYFRENTSFAPCHDLRSVFSSSTSCFECIKPPRTILPSFPPKCCLIRNSHGGFSSMESKYNTMKGCISLPKIIADVGCGLGNRIHVLLFVLWSMYLNTSQIRKLGWGSWV